MRLHSRPRFTWRALPAALLVTALLVPPAFGGQAPGAAAKPAATLSAAEREAAARVKAETIREVTTRLASKEMEGRGTGQPGADRAARYIADRFAKLGLKPLGDAGAYLQAIKFRDSQVLPESSVKAGDAMLKLGDDFVLAPPYGTEPVDVTGGLVLAGYGVTSEELKRDDLAGLDVKGKVVMLLGGRPKNAEPALWTKVAGRQAVLGALVKNGAAAIILLNIEATGQSYAMIANYLSRRRVALAGAPPPPIKMPPIIIVSSSGAEKLFSGTGATLAQVIEKAQSGENVSRDLNKTASLSLKLKNEETTSSNVVGLLEGADPRLKDQAVIYTAHYDAYGIEADGRIYPGAADNALGVGMMLAIAEAFATTPARPRRSVIFLAVTGEEYGLLGANYWVNHPTWPLEKLAADLNFDGIGTEVYGPVKRVVGFGAEHSELGAVMEDVVAATGNVVMPDPMPEERAFYRSDHFAFVRKGVPALMLLGAPEGDAGVLLARARKWLETDYHQPTDTVRPDWNWDGPRTSAVIGLLIGMRVAAADQGPKWLPSSPFYTDRGTGATTPAVK
jgi:hypothetical protein